jgi:hypothetical protein
VAALKSLMSKETIAEMEREAKGENKSLDQFLADESQKSLQSTVPQTGEEKISGNEATVQIKTENTLNWSTFSFVKEDGEWKINFK